MSAQKNKNLAWLWLSVVVIILDQVSKYWIVHKFLLNEAQPVTSFFSLVLFHNEGAAFSFLSSAGSTAVWIFSILAVVIGLLIIVWLTKLPSGKPWQACGLSLILGGALGNLIDRVAHGYVIDFLLFHYKTWAWPAFNIGDSAITVGAFILILSLLFGKKRKDS